MDDKTIMIGAAFGLVIIYWAVISVRDEIAKARLDAQRKLMDTIFGTSAIGMSGLAKSSRLRSPKQSTTFTIASKPLGTSEGSLRHIASTRLLWSMRWLRPASIAASTPVSIRPNRATASIESICHSISGKH
jgi:hypothetical protein